MPPTAWVVGITDHLQPPADLESAAFPEAEFRFLPDWRLDPVAADAWRTVDALLVWHWAVDTATVDLLDRCRIVVRYGVGYDAVDVAALHRRGIPLCNTPDYGTEEVADTACAMILALQRKLLAGDRRARSQTGTWQAPLRPLHRTGTCTLGIVGVGRIGTAVVNRMKPFGYRILGYDPYQPSGHEKGVGYERCDTLPALLARADVVSLHCPLTDETRGMVDAGFVQQMKAGAALVNTARGHLLASLDVLEAALRDGRLSAAALDVLPDEPPRAHPLIEAWRHDASWLAGRLLINPHTSFYSDEAWREMRTRAAATARRFLVEGRLRNHVPA